MNPTCPACDRPMADGGTCLSPAEAGGRIAPSRYDRAAIAALFDDWTVDDVLPNCRDCAVAGDSWHHAHCCVAQCEHGQRMQCNRCELAASPELVAMWDAEYRAFVMGGSAKAGEA